MMTEPLQLEKVSIVLFPLSRQTGALRSSLARADKSINRCHAGLDPASRIALDTGFRRC